MVVGSTGTGYWDAVRAGSESVQLYITFVVIMQKTNPRH